MERKIGSVFSYHSKEECVVAKLRVKEQDATNNHCKGCLFWEKLYSCEDNKMIGSCRSRLRSDGKHIIFKEIV